MCRCRISKLSACAPWGHHGQTLRCHALHPMRQVMRATAFIQRAYSHGRALTELLQKVVVDRPTQTTLDVLHEVSRGGNTPCNRFAHDANISCPVSVCPPARAHPQTRPAGSVLHGMGWGMEHASKVSRFLLLRTSSEAASKSENYLRQTYKFIRK